MRKLFIAAMLFAALSPRARGQGRDFQPSLEPRRMESAPADQFQRLTIPADTEAAISILSGIHSQVSHVDDLVEARLLKPVYVGDRVALPYGTLLDGRITRIQPAGRLHRAAELTFRFESVTLPDGQSEPINAILTSLEPSPLSRNRLDSEGDVHGTRNMSLKALAGGAMGLGVIAGMKASLAGTFTLGSAIPAGGAAMLAYAYLFPKGNDVNMPPDTRCRIRLNRPLTVRVTW